MGMKRILAAAALLGMLAPEVLTDDATPRPPSEEGAVVQMAAGNGAEGHQSPGSTSSYPRRESAELEYTLDELEGTNSVLILGADWCGPSKAAKNYLEREALPSFPGYRLFYFETKGETDEELKPLDEVLERHYCMRFDPPLILYFGKNTLVGGGINTESGTALRTTQEIGYTTVFKNKGLINFPLHPDENGRPFRTVPVHVILDQNMKGK